MQFYPYNASSILQLDFFLKTRYNYAHCTGQRSSKAPFADWYHKTGGYGVTVNTEVCGAFDSGSIPDSRPTALAWQGNNLNKDNLVRLRWVILVPTVLKGTKIKDRARVTRS